MLDSMRSARSAMSALVNQYWIETSTAQYGTPQLILWDSTPFQDTDVPENDIPWAKCTIKHRRQNATSLADETGLIKWGRSGIITVQCFAPLTAGQAYIKAEAMATYLRDKFQRVQSPVWYRNCEATEAGRDRGWYIFNFAADFTYDEYQ